VAATKPATATDSQIAQIANALRFANIVGVGIESAADGPDWGVMVGAATSCLDAYLLERLRHFGTCPDSSFQMSRRGFLAGLGLAAPSAGAAARLSFSPPADPTLRWRGSKLVLSYGAREWTLDSRAFGGKPRLHAGRKGDIITIRLQRALFPGTSLRCDLTCVIRRARSGWIARMTMPSIRLDAECALERWMSGTPLQARAQGTAFAAGRSQIRVGPGRRSVAVVDGLTLALHGRVRLQGPCQCTGSAIELALESSSGDASTRFHIAQPALSRHAFGCGRRDALATIRPTEVRAVDGRFFDEPAGARQSLVVEGAARLELRDEAGAATAVRFSRAVIGLSEGQLGIAGDLGSTPQLVTAGGSTALVSGHRDRPFSALFEAGEAPGFSARIVASHLWLPASGADSALITLGQEELDFVASAGNPPTFKRGYSEGGATMDAAGTILDGAGVGIALTLGRPIRIRRADNLLDVTLRFPRGFRLQNVPGTTLKLRLERTSHDRDFWLDLGYIVVTFGPQHQGEVVLPWDFAPGECPAPLAPKTDFSRESVIVFRLDPVRDGTNAPWSRRELTAKDLTDWAGLPMVVDKRASSLVLDDDLKSQLDVAGIVLGEDITSSDPRSLDAIMTAIAANFRPPEVPAGESVDTVTALELADDLLFSPAETARWERSALPSPTYPDPRRIRQDISLFSIRIGRGDDRLIEERVAQNARLRALWSHRLVDESGRPKLPLEPLTRTPPPMSSLSNHAHWQIVGQTSVYGLPALRRLREKDIPPRSLLPRFGRSPDQDTVDDNARKVPRGGVVRPALDENDPNRSLKYLEDVDIYIQRELGGTSAKAPPEAGIALATAFEQADVTLTALGATMRLDWRGEPAILRPKGKAPYGFSLERFAYETWLGRDVRVIAVEKGYLIPFGNRVSLLTVAERVFLPGSGGKPVAQEILRTFLVAPRVPKGFPAVNQPDGGRDFPAASVTLQTERTPDLIPFDSPDGGRIGGPGDPLAFWPKVRTADGKPADFEWKCGIDDDPTPLINRMIYIDAAAAGQDAAFVEKVVNAYNSDPEGRTIARLGGARRAYAQHEQAQSGDSAADRPDTAFDTDSWELQARGRILANGNVSFTMDSRMNGADQPPFYPRVETAQIAVQTIDRLIGEPQGLIKVRFYDPYVKAGFADLPGGAQNAKAEIFLEILGPEILLSVAGKQPTTGGVAQPNTIAAALSRRIGIVGGNGGKSLRAFTGQRAMGPWNFESAKNGLFNPTEFFKLKLFGVELTALIPTNGALSKAPKLIETIGFGVHGNQALDAVRKVAETAAGVLAGLKPDIQRAIDAVEVEIHPLKVAQIYPDLIKTYERDFDAIVERLTQISQATTLEQVVGPAQELAKLAAPLLREIGKVLRDPVPPQVSEAIDKILGYWASVEEAIRTFPNALGRLLAEALRQELLAVADALAPLFGLPDAAAVQALLTSPEARARLADTLFYDQIGDPLLDLLDAAFAFADEIAGRVTLTLELLRETARRAVLDAVAAFAERLIGDTSAARDILRPDDAEALAAELASAAANAIAALVPAGLPPPETLKAYRKALGDGSFATAVKDRLRQELQARRDWLHIQAPDPEAIFALFVQRVESTITAAAKTAAESRLQAVSDRVEALVQARVEVLLAWAAEHISQVAQTAATLLRATRIAQQGQALADWCDNQLTGARAMALALGYKMLAASTEIDTRLTAMKTAVGKIAALQVPSQLPEEVKARFETARAALAHSIVALEAMSVRLGQARQAVQSAATADICASFKDMGAALAAAIDARADMLRAIAVLADTASVLLEVADRSVTLAAPDGSLRAAALVTTPGDFETDLRAALADLAEATGLLMGGISFVAKAGLAGDWAAVETGVRRLAADIGETGYGTKLETVAGELKGRANAIRGELARLRAQPELLPQVAANVIGIMGFERDLASLMLQTAALERSAREKLEKVATAAVQAVGKALAAPHGLALQALEALVGIFERSEVLAYFLPDFRAFKLQVIDARRNQDDLDVLAKPSSTTQQVGDAAARLTIAWADPTKIPLFAAGVALARTLNLILQGKFGPLIAERVRALFAEARDWIERLISELIPTSISTAYNWDTKLNPNGGVFAMARPNEVGNPVLDPDKFVNDLTITTMIEYNFLTKVRRVEARGYVKSFKIGLPTADRGDFFTILFTKAEFESINGGTPHFRAEIKNVVIGPSLKLLQKLQELMAPGENGLYVEPSFTSIKVGYRLAVGLREVGSLQLINLAFDVYAELPFGDEPAVFGFRFASPERPFLISNPPYGGGGWVEIKAYANKKEIALSLMFGAVTAIRFGPLSGQGRICAGITYESKRQLLIAFVEAVGEGNIACFSIAIFIRISLTHYPSGRMVGEATYRFTFKMGFVSVSYSVNARYTINDKGGRAAPDSLGALGEAALALARPLAALVAGTAGPTHLSDVPGKSFAWNEYRNLVSMDLLDAA